jgi:hypothetical protein
LQMPRSKRRAQQLKACREKKRHKKEEAKQAPQKTRKERVRNIDFDSGDEEEAVYKEMLLDEFGKAMQDVFEIFQNRRSEDDDQEHRTVTSRAAIETERLKKPSSRLAETIRTKQRRFSFPKVMM